ncbi:amidohydrolase family protein [Marinobacterium rhizophilum]|uniref:Amidohydrolase family protein n=1 Tax=Marinobacterium rhizophilum TaxID=420402 RepID=A0ABY5HLT7_9GAMM|nr:amidohydrolase family protein [Marinobacterium rhizophilum]UTW13351.1 amidohydrolase family protein [Marinobacterium rhizophilum]
MHNNSLLIRNVRPLGKNSADLLVRDGTIVALGTDLNAEGAAILEGAGQLLLPGLVDAHTHIDKTFWGQPWQRHQAGPRIIDKIENERRLRRELKLSAETQSANQIRQAIRMGTTHIRTHVDVDTEIGLSSIEAVLASKEHFRESMTLQLVAFPQSGLMIRPGTQALLEAAIDAGADLVGGIDPGAIDRDPAGQLDCIFDIAERKQVGIDIHLHEADQLGATSIELILERTRALGMQGQVTISHAFCLGMLPEAQLSGLIESLQALDITIMTHGPGHIAFPPIKRLYEAGVRVCAGSDGIRDAWGPYGNADMLERAMLMGFRSNYRHDDELEMILDICSFGGARVMGMADYGLEPGCSADFVLVDAETPTHAIVSRPPRSLVCKAGRIVARNGECLV